MRDRTIPYRARSCAALEHVLSKDSALLDNAILSQVRTRARRDQIMAGTSRSVCTRKNNTAKQGNSSLPSTLTAISVAMLKLTPYNLAKHEHYLTVAERIIAAHRDGLRSREQ